MRAFVCMLSVVVACWGIGAQDEKERVFDCGVNAAFLIRRIRGMDADLNEISDNLSRHAEKGSSIHDLETYLRSSGIQTDARKMRLSDLCKKQGALAILLISLDDTTRTGHFVVARVLPDGRLQILDPLVGAYTDGNATASKEERHVIFIKEEGAGNQEQG